MMFFFFVFAVGISLISSQKPCCGPSQWESTLSSSRSIQLSSGLQGGFASYNYSCDFDAKLIAMSGVTYDNDQRKTNVRIIEDYASNILYYINLDQNVCLKEDLSLPLIPCIPDTATYIHSYMYGYGDKQIPGHMWLIKEANFHTYMAVSGDGNCVPLTQTISLSSPVPVIISITITDFTPGIKDRNVFVIPDICKKM